MAIERASQLSLVQSRETRAWVVWGGNFGPQKKKIYSWNYKLQFSFSVFLRMPLPPLSSTPFHHLVRVAPFKKGESSGHIFTRSLSSSGANRAPNTYQCLSTVLEGHSSTPPRSFRHMVGLSPLWSRPTRDQDKPYYLPTWCMSHAHVFSSTGPAEAAKPSNGSIDEEENTSTAEYHLRR
jgi:hypothetical protein